MKDLFLSLKQGVAAVLIGTASFSAFFPSRVLAETVPDDPLYFKQWYLDAIHAPAAWDFSKGSPAAVVAILDSGVDLWHPDLHERIWANPGEIAGNGIDDDGNGFVDDAQGWDFVDGDADPNPSVAVGSLVDGANHGTLVAGIVAAAGGNREGISGVAWNARIMPLRVLDSRGSGGTTQVERAVRYAVREGARVINISFTGSGYSPSLAQALRDARRAGVLVVVAAGNEGDTERGGDLNFFPSYPACYRDEDNRSVALGVAALDRQGRKSSFSSFGSDCVGISAPGESFISTQVLRPDVASYSEAYGEGWNGSSLAAPVVSGVAALIFSMDPSLDSEGVRAFLTSTAQDVDSLNGTHAGHLGAGRVDAAAAVRAVQEVMLGAAPPAIPDADGTAGRLVKLAGASAVYYLGVDGQRYVFPNEKTYLSWFPGQPSVRTISASEMAKHQLGGNVTYRPGVKMIKIQTDPRTYVVAKGGVLRHVASEEVAAALYGSDWRRRIEDVSEAFFVNYRVGTPVASVLDVDPAAERDRAASIDVDKNLLPTRP